MRDFSVTVDVDLLRRYDKSGPRYTSYPTAPYFHQGVGAREYALHLDRDDRELQKRDLSLYFHIPFCDTLCYFCGCNMTVSRNQARIGEYLTYLEKEISLVSARVGKDRKVIQMHWGGGTPTHLSPDQIRRLGAVIRLHFDFRPEAEISVEIDPRELTRRHMQALAEVGFNRCSIGVQDFDVRVQEAVNRIQSEVVTRQAVEWARELGFTSVNVDLMYGLPHQQAASFSDTIDRVLTLDPDRLAVFNYAHLPGMIKHQRLINEEWLPDREEKLQLLKISIEKLTEAGYGYIGMDHFAKPEDELTIAMQEGTLYRNFQGYSTHAGLNVLAFGVSGIGMLSDMYIQNHKTFREYYALLDRGELPIAKGVVLTRDDQLRREVITTLMCHFELDKAAVEREYGIRFDDFFAASMPLLEGLEADGLVELLPDRILVTNPGRLLIRNIAMCFDGYLLKKEEGAPQFSRTV
ncbi:MAG TPA: oxygen-independent coproporphyrinogen III oxidase [Flavilitoribacter sp.]|nr:oxygen-independent coproporphyrinogen III oxidase [Flavilitoribacter sp.]